MFKQDKDRVVITNGGSVFNIEKELISISSEKTIRISAPEVRLGGSNQAIVTTASPLSSFELPGGVILNKSSKVFG